MVALKRIYSVCLAVLVFGNMALIGHAGIIAHLRFDDTLDDEVGNYSNAPMGAGTVEYDNDGIADECLELFGTNGIPGIECLSDNTIGFEQITVSVWYKLKSEPPGYGTLFDYTPWSEQKNMTFDFRPNLWLYSGNVGFGAESRTLDTWYHAAFVCHYIGAGNVTGTVYWNESSVSYVRTWGDRQPHPMDHLTIGSEKGIPERTIDGYIDDVQIYDFALGDELIAELRDNPGEVVIPEPACMVVALLGLLMLRRR